ncbi:HAMP domain-containing histidine kinase [Thermosulfurimonas marina]|uniref:histidine kinase n=1 Tax=Thermosulfurimonas marina TaxID=2047767 RepID=A0A6H1WSQ3_9BACT|nr:HAMP domain-containing sensor histidine kinase [Thermosulfurimonas marina]QJA06156.1 HAMP domain-containing histidine kinase [Thermosulfurimonas marina]
MKGWRTLAAVGAGLLVATFVAEAFLLRRTLSEHQRFEAAARLGMLESRLTSYLELLAVLPEPPAYLRTLAWLTDELQSDPGLVGVRILEGSHVLLDTFPTNLSGISPSWERCPKGYRSGNLYFLCRESELAPGRRFRLLVVFDASISNLLFQEALWASALILLGALMVLLGGAYYLARTEKKARELEKCLSASERLATLGRLSAMIAHEIRNPLHTLSLAFQYALEDPEALRENRALIQREIQRLSELTAELLTLDRGLEIRPERLHPEEVVVEIESRFREKFRARGLSWEASWEDFAFSGDRRWLLRALANLLQNALLAPSGHQVKLSVFREGREAVFRVCNTGTRLPSVPPERLFEAFFTTRNEGFGIGLYLVKQVAEAHGGRVQVREKGGWVCFEMRLPWSS